MFNKLEYLFLHCTATRFTQEVTVDTIKTWHMSPPPQGRGWDRPGYRCLVDKQGAIHRIVKANLNAIVEPNEVTWGVGPAYNGKSHHVVYAGGYEIDGTTMRGPNVKQRKAFELIIHTYLKMNPDVIIIGHNQVANKGCPSFWVPDWLRSIDCTDWGIAIQPKNITDVDPFGYQNLLPPLPAE